MTGRAVRRILPDMTVQARLSAKGQIVIPKDVRDRLGLVEGMVFDVIETGDAVIFRKPTERPRLTLEQVTARMREIYQHKGPPVTDEQIAAAGPAMAVKRYRRFLKSSGT